MGAFFTKFSEAVSNAAGHYLAFIAAILFIIIWAISGPLFNFSDTWQLIVNTSTTIVTFLMVFLIQNAQNRDSCALHTKLDELISILEDGRDNAIGIEHLPLSELKKIRNKIEQESVQQSD